ncbi:MAG TPA: hypothetical protein VIA80_00520 [Hyphomonadaceae bacterium]
MPGPIAAVSPAAESLLSSRSSCARKQRILADSGRSANPKPGIEVDAHGPDRLHRHIDPGAGPAHRAYEGEGSDDPTLTWIRRPTESFRVSGNSAYVLDMPIKMVSGWGVIRLHPWRLAGIHPTELEAEQHRRRLGPAFIVRHGDGCRRTGDFFWASRDE